MKTISCSGFYPKNPANSFNPDNKQVTEIYTGENLTSFEVSAGKLYIGTTDGYLVFDTKTRTERRTN